MAPLLSRQQLEALGFAERTYDEYLEAYARWRSANVLNLADERRQIEAIVQHCGPRGLVENPAALIARGLVPYIDPITLEEGLVPDDVIKLHGTCVSRFTAVRLALAAADETAPPRAPTDLEPLTRADMAALGLDADTFRFFRSAGGESLPPPERQPLFRRNRLQQFNLGRFDPLPWLRLGFVLPGAQGPPSASLRETLDHMTFAVQTTHRPSAAPERYDYVLVATLLEYSAAWLAESLVERRTAMPLDDSLAAALFARDPAGRLGATIGHTIVLGGMRPPSTAENRALFDALLGDGGRRVLQQIQRIAAPFTRLAGDYFFERHTGVELATSGGTGRDQALERARVVFFILATQLEATPEIRALLGSTTATGPYADAYLLAALDAQAARLPPPLGESALAALEQRLGAALLERPATQ